MKEHQKPGAQPEGRTPSGRASTRQAPPPFDWKSPKSTPRTSPKTSTATGWDQFLHNRGGPPSARRQGFAPATPGSGDEPPARNTSAYANMSRGQRPQSFASSTNYDPYVPGTAPTAKKATPAQKPKTSGGSEFADQTPSRPGLERVDTRYATAGGEKTYFSSAGLGRTASVRTPEHHHEWREPRPTSMGDPASPNSRRHRSASPLPRRSNRERLPSTSSESSGDEADQEFWAQRPKKTPRPRVKTKVGATNLGDEFMSPGRSSTWGQTGEIPRNKSENLFTQARNSGKASNDEAPKPNRQGSSTLGKSRSWHENGVNGTQGNSEDAKSSTPNGGTANGNPSMYGIPRQGPFPFPLTLNQSPSSDPKKKSPNSPLTPSKWPKWAIPSSVLPKGDTTVQASRFQSTDPRSILLPEIYEEERMRKWLEQSAVAFGQPANLRQLNSFTVPPGISSPRSRHNSDTAFKSHSSENINTAFSPSAWTGEFTGSREYFTPMPRKDTSRQRTSPTRNTRAQQTRNTPRQSPQPAAQPAEAPFANHDVPQTQKEDSAIPPTQSKFSAEEWANKLNAEVFKFPPPPNGAPPPKGTFAKPKSPIKAKSTTQRSNVPKPVSVADESEQRAAEIQPEAPPIAVEEDYVAMDIDSPMQETEQPAPPATEPRNIAVEPNRPDWREPTTEKKPSRFTRRSAGVSQTRAASNSLRVNLSPLQNVAPFAPSSEGLSDLADLSTTLPFDSRPATDLKPTPAQNLSIPNPPKPPLAPTNPTKPSWERYLLEMGGYMHEWDKFNKLMLQHFNERQKLVDQNPATTWMRTFGSRGYENYMQGVQEDFRVRQHWEVAWEKHKQCVVKLGEVREKVLNGGFK